MDALRRIEDWPVAHAAAGFARADDVVAVHGDVEHRFAWGSVTKLLVAYATLVAAEEGALDLDEPSGPAGSSRSSAPSSAATSVAYATSSFVTDPQANRCSTSPCTASTWSARAIPAAACSAGHFSIRCSASTGRDGNYGSAVGLLVFAFRRLLWAVPLLLFVMLATFALLRGMGGDPFVLPEGFTGVPLPLERDLRAYYRLDEPWIVEFAHYVANVVTGDFGPSLNRRGLTVDAVIERSLPVTGQLVGLAALVAVPVGVALGLLAALRRGRPADTGATAFSTLLLVVPVFFVAWLLSRYPALQWRWVPLGWGSWDARVLPVLTLALAPAGYIARLVRAAVVETIGEDYVRTARAKGLRRDRIVLVHVLRNSLVPVLSAAVPMLALLVTGALFVEEYFGVPGASGAFLDAARVRDFPMVMGLTVVLAAIVIALNLVADVLIAMLDPRVREGR